MSVEADPDRAAAAATLFEHDADVRILAGDWRDLLPAEAPFDLLFVDAHDAKDDVDAVVGLMMPGGTAYLDDFTYAPGSARPAPRRLAPARRPRGRRDPDHARATGNSRAPHLSRSAPVG